MVENALSLAIVYKAAEANTINQLLSCGALLSAETIADAKERLLVWRYALLSLLNDARAEASAEQTREIDEALSVITASF